MPKMKKKSPRTKAAQQRLQKAEKRNNEEFRQEEQQVNTAAHEQARRNLQFREAEQERDKAAHRQARREPSYRNAEQERNTIAHREVREEPAYRDAEQERNTAAHREAREEPAYRQAEQERDLAAHRQAREDPKVRDIEQRRNTAAHQLNREDPEVRQEERKRDKVARRAVRTDPDVRTPEKEQDQLYRAKRRADPLKRKLDFEIAEASTAKKRKLAKCKEFTDLVDEFNAAIRSSATHVCVSCGRLEYKEKMNQCAITDFVKTIICVDEVPIQVCNTCHRSIKRNKVPKLCLKNGLDFCKLPPALKDLSPLEERLISPRIPFMQIRAVGFIRQLKIKGAVVNIENDLEVSVKWIPRNYEETSTIQVDLMRRMNDRNPYMSEMIRPGVVMRAARFLVKQPLYERFGINLNMDWDMDSDSDIDFIVDEDVRNSRRLVEMDDASSTSSSENGDYFEMNRKDFQQLSLTEQNEHEMSHERISAALSSDEEDTDQVNSDTVDTTGAAESLIFSATDIAAIRMAPGEGRRPIPLYKDQFVEELCFPRCYGGQMRIIDENLKISYTEIKKSELLRYDRRACRPTHILFAFRKSFESQLTHALQIYMRKRTGSKTYTAGEALEANFLEKLARNDEGYAIWKNVRSTPAYWQNQGKKGMGMIRQCGKFTIFLTLSSGETAWGELLVMLVKSQEGKDISEEEALSLTSERKAELIRNDPVMCTRHFYHRYYKLRTLILKRQNGLFGCHNVTDHFARVEYQMRGAPHIHALLYLENAPVYIEGDAESEMNCIEFIDKFITVERDESEEMKDLINRQLHKHSHTCYKTAQNKRQCRFGYPIPPLPSTMFLGPLPPDTTEKEKQRLVEIFSKIKTELLKRGRYSTENPSFEEFLGSFEPKISREDYILAIRSSLKRLTVFHKRDVNAAYINRYNKDLLLIWRANLDIQFVTDTYACATYCLSYMMKTEGGISQLMRIANDQVRKGNIDVKEKLKAYARVLNNGTETSVPECVAFLLSLPSTDCSRTDVFVNTCLPEERTCILKSKKDLSELPESSTDIYEKGLIYRYTQRPMSEEFENMCLAEFATSYNFERCKTERESNEIDVEDTQEATHNARLRERVVLLDESGSISRRNVSDTKILRFRCYKKSEDPANYWREQLMLFTPWRDEETQLLKINAEEEAANLIDLILQNSKPYFHNREMDDTNIRDLLIRAVEEEDDPDLQLFVHMEEDEDDLVDALTEAVPNDHLPSAKFEQFLPPLLIPDEHHLSKMRLLNADQKKFVLQILTKVKQNEIFHYFLHGGAGVGKTHAILALVQCVLRQVRSCSNFDPSRPPVVVTAFTGKAACCVGGMTLHCCFNLPRSSYEGEVLTDSALSSLRSRLFNLKLLIIDEISMVSVKQLYQIDQRLRQIFNTNADFGGRSVLIVGHLRQLSPIAGKYAFDTPNHLSRGLLGGNHLWEKFKFFELTEIMRQRGQHQFCKALNNLSEGCMDEDDINLLRSRTVAQTGPPSLSAVHLFQTNKECDAHNEKVHSQLDTLGFLSIAKDSVEGLGTEERRAKMIESAKSLPVKDCDGLKYETFLKEEALYFISTNIDVSDGLFNGATGILKKLEFTPGTEKLKHVWMEFPNKVTGEKLRKAKQAIINKKSLENPMFTELIPISKITRKLQKHKSGQGLTLIRSQFPLVACNGMTIAKSQGSTMETVVVSTKRKLRIQDLYVACSRVTSMQGLFIDGPFDPPKLPGPAKDATPDEVRDPVTIALQELRTKPILFDLKSFSEYGSDCLKVQYHNIRSFGKYSKDLLLDSNANLSDVVIIVEPHLLPEDAVELPGYILSYRQNCTGGTRNSEGILIFSKESRRKAKNIFCNRYKDQNGHCFFCILEVEDIAVVAIYRSPNFSSAVFKRHLRKILEPASSTSTPVVFVGDCNFDLRDPINENFVDIFAGNNLQSLLDTNKPTTVNGSHLDLCFSNNLKFSAFISETYYSDHSPICLVYSPL